jgi:uridine monophosphate synthetase
MDLEKELINVKCIKYGNFTLKSGIQSNLYFDIRSVISFPHIYKVIIDRLYKLISVYKFDYIVGVPVSGILFAAPIAEKYGIPMLVVRKETKDHGTKKEIEGVYTKGKRCLIIDDVITSGASVIETVDKLKRNGLDIERVVVVLDRKGGGQEKLGDINITLDSMLNIDLLSGERVVNKFNSKLLDIMTKKKTNVALAADLTKKEDIIDLTRRIGKYICLLKLHSDIIDDFDLDFIEQLKGLSKEYNFAIMEDRKYADIGKIMERQINNGPFKISEWADFITVHGLPGMESIRTIDNIGIVLISEMSTKGNLITKEYTQSVIDMANNMDNISGFVGQNCIKDDRYINFTPGVSMSSKLDSKGQTYRTPEDVMLNGNTSVIIVGSDIYSSDNPEERVREYQETTWKLYNHNL